MIAGTTITDDQIHDLRDEAWTIYAEACRALGFSPIGGQKYADPDSARPHRYRCAAILAARQAGAK